MMTDLPLFVICRRCKTAFSSGTFKISDIPVQKAPRVRCSKRHTVHLAEYYNHFDNTPLMEQRMLHVARPTETALLGSGWLTRAEADKLFALVTRFVETGETGPLAQASERFPDLRSRVRASEAWTRTEWIALASLLVATLSPVAETLLSQAADQTDDQTSVVQQHQQELIDQQQRHIEHLQDELRRQLNEEHLRTAPPQTVDPDSIVD